jgi:NAD(P)H-hydrate epimerase
MTTSPVVPAAPSDLLGLSLDELADRWSDAAARSAIGAEAMTGADRRAQLEGVPGVTLMENAGTAVAAAALALADERGTLAGGPILVLCGPGNNGGDGFVAARHLAAAGEEVAVVLCATQPKPGTPDAGRNWDRLANLPGVTRLHAPTANEISVIAQGIERAALVMDALLGTGVRGTLREPIRAAMVAINRARRDGVPVLAVDTPTAVDLSSGEPSNPVVAADVTVTFHRPKVGLRTKIGARLAGRVLVAPIGIPPAADRG